MALKGWCRKKHRKIPNGKIDHWCIRVHCRHLKFRVRRDYGKVKSSIGNNLPKLQASKERV